MKLGMYNMAPEPISAAYFIDPFHQSVYMCISILLLDNGSVKSLPRKRIQMQQEQNCSKRRFLCGTCSIKGESVGLSVYPPIVARQRLGKLIPAAMKNCWRRHFLCDPRRIKEN
jgi:hypothetical protein